MRDWIALAHDDRLFREHTSDCLRKAGYEVTTFSDPVVTINTIEACQLFHTLITQVTFPPGKPNGISLALLLLPKNPGLRVIFVGSPECEPQTKGIGLFIAQPLSISRLLEAVQSLSSATEA